MPVSEAGSPGGWVPPQNGCAHSCSRLPHHKTHVIHKVNGAGRACCTSLLPRFAVKPTHSPHATTRPAPFCRPSTVPSLPTPLMPRHYLVICSCTGCLKAMSVESGHLAVDRVIEEQHAQQYVRKHKPNGRGWRGSCTFPPSPPVPLPAPFPGICFHCATF